MTTETEPPRRRKKTGRPLISEAGPAQIVAVRVPPDLLVRIKRAARVDYRSTSQFMVLAAVERAERIEKERGDNDR